jgi:hypothetical protein
MDRCLDEDGLQAFKLEGLSGVLSVSRLVCV